MKFLLLLLSGITFCVILLTLYTPDSPHIKLFEDKKQKIYKPIHEDNIVFSVRTRKELLVFDDKGERQKTTSSKILPKKATLLGVGTRIVSGNTGDCYAIKLSTGANPSYIDADTTADQLVFWLGSDLGDQLIIGDADNYGDDYGFVSTAFANSVNIPTLYIGDGIDTDLFGNNKEVIFGSTSTSMDATANFANPKLEDAEITVTGIGGNCAGLEIEITSYIIGE